MRDPSVPLLAVEDVGIRFGGLAALNGVSFAVRPGEILGIIGPNGAGKTTLFNVITGMLRPTAGAIRFRGEDITGLPSYAICRRGIARTFQLIRIFPSLSVMENVLVGAYFGHGARDGAGAGGPGEALDHLRFVGLEAVAHRPAGGLPMAGRKRLEIARALATRPAVLLLDEVIAGLTPAEVGDLMALIARIRSGGITVLLIEHIMKAIMNLSDRIVVLHHGEKLAEGPPQAIARNAAVVAAYLGEQAMAD